MTFGSVDVTNIPAGTILLDKYRVIRTLGVGGMGAVVCAEHLTLRTLVAMKFLLPQFLTNVDAGQRFIREARAATKIVSEHIAQVLDVGTLPQGIPYIVMEYLEGKDLSAWLQSGIVFSVEDAIEYIAQAGEALIAAHRMNIIHRDVKPANLFLTRRLDGSPLVKVLDFGISKISDDSPSELHLTKTTAVLGSGLYMSPEQMKSAKTVDHRADIYSLGICCYELLTGKTPFDAMSFSELVLKVNMEEPESILEHRGELPVALALAIAKAYARDPKDRYQSISEFLKALAPFATGSTRTRIEAIIMADGGRIDDIAEFDPSMPPLKSTARIAPHSIRPIGTMKKAKVFESPQAKANLLGLLLVVVVGGIIASVFFVLRHSPAQLDASNMPPIVPETASIPTTDTATTMIPKETLVTTSSTPTATKNTTSKQPKKPTTAATATKPPCNPNEKNDAGLRTPCF